MLNINGEMRILKESGGCNRRKKDILKEKGGYKKGNEDTKGEWRM